MGYPRRRMTPEQLAREDAHVSRCTCGAWRYRDEPCRACQREHLRESLAMFAHAGARRTAARA